jgi:hypothetical protein
VQLKVQSLQGTIVETKHILEVDDIFAILKHKRVDELDNPITPEDLNTINFAKCMHGMKWAMESGKGKISAHSEI